MIEEYYKMYDKNFPFLIKDKHHIQKVLSDENNQFIEKRNKNNELIGLSVINNNTIYLLCVNSQYRKKGIGTELLKESEKIITENGYNKIIIGLGQEYIMPGIPSKSMPYFENLNYRNITPRITNEAKIFFEKRGYFHSWDKANCFDMIQDLTTYIPKKTKNQDLNYRWATIADMPKILICTDEGYHDYSKYYLDKNIYQAASSIKILLAEKNDEIYGVTIVNIHSHNKEFGNIQHTVVLPKYRHHHIGTDLIISATNFLFAKQVKIALIDYTYSGLERLYGPAGYRIYLFYNMSTKIIANEEII